MRSFPLSAPGAWARCTARATRRCSATSRSRSCCRLSPTIPTLVEGPTLADRIAGGAIPIGEALAIAKQILEALEAAHDAGVIHRDLKPANIKIKADGTVKVLDFGLAKALDPTASSNADAMNSPTLSNHATQAGVILGTAAYMSPEQAKGGAVGKRADLWAFGATLYEMLTGRRAFRGEGVSDTMARVLMEEPDWTALPARTPVPVRRLLQRCLQKDRQRRIESAADARLDVEEALAAPATVIVEATRPHYGRAMVLAAVASSVVMLVALMWVVMRPAPHTVVLPSRFAIVPPSAQPLNVSGSDRDLALSPDGRHLVYRAGGDRFFGSPLMVRATDQLDAHQLPDIGALGVFSSPDSRWIGFFTTAALKKVSITGGPAVTLCQVSGVPLGASWGDDNTIVFATDDPSTGLWRVSADGGKTAVLTTPDAVLQPGRRRHRYRRPADDEYELAVPDVDHAGRVTRRCLRKRVKGNVNPGGARPSGPAVSPDEPREPTGARPIAQCEPVEWSPPPSPCSTEPGRSSRPTVATSRTR